MSKQNYRYHVKEILKYNPEPVAWPQMLICGLATGLPLYVGFYNNHLLVAIYGALTGYFLTLSEISGTNYHKIKVTTTTFFLLIFGFALGLFLLPYKILFYGILSALVYLVGLMAEEGAEHERALLFGTVLLIIAHYIDHPLSFAQTLMIFNYSFIGYCFALTAILIYSLISKKPASSYMKFREAWKKTFVSPSTKHKHALIYALTAMSLVGIVEYSHIPRGYWAIITVMLILKPDRRQSIYRTLQRLIGTALAVIFIEGIVTIVHVALPMLILITVCASLVPWALKKNYTLVAFLITSIVLLLLDLAAVEKGDFLTPILRLKSTALGCIFGVVGVLVSKLLSSKKATPT